ncbi:hypothetical protein RXV86_05490 [Alisedimentitalea sp. MJ-SS2]|uniref:DUF3592 domain-containing protein n=1 Tax=Aliisedimentitalea sp. MJ-SS2 TaxID=3049795 RepID=UPI00290CD64B|nr:DUF3592 domain-containing protein [Alisedimentitalea sp. MJ-SS2]MDU8926828.1 hypothetical protein [Alisedimentitalea sp. MJ-SS2]
MFLFSQPFLFGTDKSGNRVVSWRVWLLIWIVPGLFVLAALGLLAEAGYRQLSTVPGTGEVVRVYEWEGETPFDKGRMNYGPVFRYEFQPGEMTEASTGKSHPGWNFEIGTRMPIRYTPNRKVNVMLPGGHNWAVPGVIGLFALMMALPAWWGHRRVRRWQRG